MKLVPNNTPSLRAPRSNSWIMHWPQISSVPLFFFLVSPLIEEVWSREQKGGQSDGRIQEENGNWVLSGRGGLNTHTHTHKHARTYSQQEHFLSVRPADLLISMKATRLDWPGRLPRFSRCRFRTQLLRDCGVSLSRAPRWIKYTPLVIFDIFHNTDQRPHFWLIYLPQAATFVIFKGLFLAHDAARKPRGRFINWKTGK